MSDDEADPELVELLRQSLLGEGAQANVSLPAETKVLSSAQYIFDSATDVALDSQQTKAAAEKIWQRMQAKRYSMKTWSMHELHPKAKDESTVNFIFTMDLLNFSFWSEETDASRRFAVEYRGTKWTGYWSLVAALQRAIDEEIPITSPEFWHDEEQCTEEVLQHVFRSANAETIPLFQDRMHCLRQAGQILCDNYDGSFTECIADANGSAARLVNILAEQFPVFRDEAVFEDRKVRFYKRAQILVADLWACFEGQGYGQFDDIDKITIFADYRIPQMLHQLNCLRFSPRLESHLRQLKPLPSGSRWELEIRGTTIWAVELIVQHLRRTHPETAGVDITAGSDDDQHEINGDEREEDVAEKKKKPVGINAILVDFFLYDTMKETEKQGHETIPHHRTRSIWY